MSQLTHVFFVASRAVGLMLSAPRLHHVGLSLGPAWQPASPRTRALETGCPGVQLLSPTW